MATLRQPLQGLKILKELHAKQPYHQGVTNSLMNAYISFGYHDIALEMINDIPGNKTDANYERNINVATLRQPLQGLKILKELHAKQPYHQGVTNSLINAYISFGYHDIALEMITDIPDNKTDANSLIFKAWQCHKYNDFEKEQDIWYDILERKFYIQLHNRIDTLLLRSEQPISLTIDDIPLFCIERNEMLRLPFLLEYYRELGVTQFIFVDNNSDDGSFEFLLEQEDCHVFWTNDSFSESGYGFRWCDYLVDKYVNQDQWYLVVDADEFLVYPSCEKKELPELISYLDCHNYNALASFVLDMFPKNLEKQLNILPEKSLIKQAPYFYNHYVFGHQRESPYHKVRGGIFHVMGQELGLNVTPLIKKTKEPIRLLSSRHSTTQTTIADITSCLLHFKFVGDFHQKALQEIRRKEHCAGGIAYKRYAKMFTSTIDDNFLFTDLPKTTKYQNSQQLVDLGLIKCHDEWKDFIVD